jgi:hypothetical protein
MRPVLIIWEDAASQPTLAWEDRECQAMTKTIAQTIGFVVHEGPERIEVAMAYTDHQIAGRWVIPKTCIISIQELS